MARSLNAALVTEATAAYFSFIVFADIVLHDSTIYVHNALGSYTFGGQTYLGVGDFGTVESVEEGNALSPYSISLTLSGLDATLMSDVLTERFYLRAVNLYLGALDSAGALVADPDKIWSGFTDHAEIVTGSVNAIRLICESEMAIFDRTNGRTFSNADQQNAHSGDVFFEYLPQMADLNIVWAGRMNAGLSGSVAPFIPIIPGTSAPFETSTHD